MTSAITIVGLTAIGGPQQIVLQWGVNDPNIEGLGYLRFDHAEVWVATNVAMSGAARVDGGNAFSAFVHVPLARGVTRYYQVRAVDRSGQFGAFSTVAAATEISGDVLLANPGFWVMPNGLIFEWGTAVTSLGACAAVFQRITQLRQIVGVTSTTLSSLPLRSLFKVTGTPHAFFVVDWSGNPLVPSFPTGAVVEWQALGHVA